MTLIQTKENTSYCQAQSLCRSFMHIHSCSLTHIHGCTHATLTQLTYGPLWFYSRDVLADLRTPLRGTEESMLLFCIDHNIWPRPASLLITVSKLHLLYGSTWVLMMKRIALGGWRSLIVPVALGLEVAEFRRTFLKGNEGVSWKYATQRICQIRAKQLLWPWITVAPILSVRHIISQCVCA